MKNMAQEKILNCEKQAQEIAKVLNEIHNLLTSSKGHNLTHIEKEQLISRLCILTEKNTTYFKEINYLTEDNVNNFIKALIMFIPELIVYSCLFSINPLLSFLVGAGSIKYLATKAKQNFEPFRETKKVINQVYENSQSNAHRIINYEEILLTRMNHEQRDLEKPGSDFDNKIIIANYYIDLALGYYLDLDVITIPEEIKQIIILILQDVLKTNESNIQNLFIMARQTVANEALANSQNK